MMIFPILSSIWHLYEISENKWENFSLFKYGMCANVNVFFYIKFAFLYTVCTLCTYIPERNSTLTDSHKTRHHIFSMFYELYVNDISGFTFTKDYLQFPTNVHFNFISNRTMMQPTIIIIKIQTECTYIYCSRITNWITSNMTLSHYIIPEESRIRHCIDFSQNCNPLSNKLCQIYFSHEFINKSIQFIIFFYLLMQHIQHK